VEVVVAGHGIASCPQQAFEGLHSNLFLGLFHEGEARADGGLLVFHGIGLSKAEEAFLLFYVELNELREGELSD
jgi:hypothetical protein